MAIRNATLGGTDFQDGEVLYNYDLDDTFNATLKFTDRVIGKDLTGGSVSSSSTTNWTLLASVSIPANTAKDYIIIKFLCNSNTTYDSGSSSGDSSTSFDIRAGESGSVSSIKSISPINVGFHEEFGSIGGSQMLEWYYEPTSSEITNGFNIEIYGKVTINQDQSGSCGVDQLLIIG